MLKFPFKDFTSTTGVSHSKLFPPKVLNTSQKYKPVYCVLDVPSIMITPINTFLEGSINAALITEINDPNSGFLSQLYCKKALTLKNQIGYETGVPNLELLETYTSVCATGIEAWTKLASASTPEMKEGFITTPGTFAKVEEQLEIGYPTKFIFRNYTLFVRSNSIVYFDAEYPKGITLFTLCLDTTILDVEHYFKMCRVTDSEPNGAVLKLLIHPEFDVKASKFSSIRTWFRKTYKPMLLSKGVEFIENSDIFNTLYSTIVKPSDIKTISGYEDWLAQIGDEFKDHNRTLQGLSASGRDIQW